MTGNPVTSDWFAAPPTATALTPSRYPADRLSGSGPTRRPRRETSLRIASPPP
jgi:hypothetical protein